ncbi:hypothetical protein B0H11DRAFT_1745017, partial [Mycena galericulata]
QRQIHPNPDDSRYSKLLALHFNDCGRFEGAKCLVSGLDKSRLARLGHAERTYHVQLPCGGDHRGAHLQFEDPSEYALLASSGTDRLPSGPFNDDTTAISDLRVALRVLSFQPMPPVLPLPSAALMSTNITFLPADNNCEGATVSPASLPAFQLTIRLLGVPRDDSSSRSRTAPPTPQGVVHRAAGEAQGCGAAHRHPRRLPAQVF